MVFATNSGLMSSSVLFFDVNVLIDPCTISLLLTRVSYNKPRIKELEMNLVMTSCLCLELPVQPKTFNNTDVIEPMMPLRRPYVTTVT
jgi:hypothetical protein